MFKEKAHSSKLEVNDKKKQQHISYADVYYAVNNNCMRIH